MMNKLKKGFTLVELLIAMVVGLVIMAAIYAMVNTGQGSSASIGRRVLTQQDARAVLDFMAMEIRMASFNPLMNLDVWSTVPATAVSTILAQTLTCNKTGLASSVRARKGIQIATANKILIAMDLGSASNAAVPDGIIGSADNEYITYEFDSGTGTIRRRVRCGDDEPILGGTGSSTMVRNNQAPVTPLFQYFTVNGTEIVAPDDSNIVNIKRIRITIVADVETQGSTFKVSRRTYSTDVLVRNHAISP